MTAVDRPAIISLSNREDILHSNSSTCLEIHTGFPPGFLFVSKTCHEPLSTINRDKVSVSVFFTFVTV